MRVRMLHRQLRRLTRAMGVLACLIVSSGAQAETLRESWNVPTTPFRVIGNIYYVGTSGLSSWLIATPAGHVLLDGALEESAPQIERNIQTLGFRVQDIQYLLNSHAHFDHSAGLAKLKEDSGATMVASEGDVSALEGGFYLGWESVRDLDSVPVQVDRSIADGATVVVGDVTLTAHLTPGHTRGCTSWSMPVKDAGRTLQVLFVCSTSVAANRLVSPPQYPGIVADYEATFKKLQALKIDVFLAPHAEIFDMPGKRARLSDGGANPFIDATALPAYVASSEADFRKQLELQKAKAGSK